MLLFKRSLSGGGSGKILPREFQEESYLDLNRDVAESIGRGEFVSGADHWLRHGRHEVRRMRKPDRRAKGAEAHVKWIGTKLLDGQTRDCIDPWGYIQVKATGEVLPCCAHPPVGRISDSVSLTDIINGKRLEALRSGLLSGRLNKYCVDCSMKSPTSNMELRRSLTRHQFQSSGVKLGADGRLALDERNALPGWIRFENVVADRFWAADTITIFAGKRGRPAPRVVFENLDWSSDSIIDIVAWVPENSAAVSCEIMAAPPRGELAVVDRFTVFRGEAYNITGLLPTNFRRGEIAVAVHPLFEDANVESTVLTFSFPILRHGSPAEAVEA